MLRGVISVEPGYAGGKKGRPTYEEVSGGRTGHAEVIQIVYDPSAISYRDLLTVFFGSHDPTTPNRQRNDVGTQYRSVIFWTSDAQKREAEAFIKELDGSHAAGAPIVTEVTPLDQFYPAEDYHKDYYARNQDAGYCRIIINPKLEKVQHQFAALLKDEAKLKDSEIKTMPKTDNEWKAKLTPEQYRVMREKATEAPNTGKYVHENSHGIYTCVGCGAPLFASGSKFDSGTGWPSFDQALPGAVTFEHDDQYGEGRTEIVCSKCGSHLGHVFEDGPAETTGNRFCVNSVCLDLKKTQT